MSDATHFLRVLISALVLASVAGTAGAQNTFSMTGRAATGAGAFVDLPALGDAPCLDITGAIGFATMVPQTMTGALGAYTPLTGAMSVPHNPFGCIPGGPAVVMTNGTGGFTVPAGFFDQPFPGGGTTVDLNAVPVPNVPQIVQLATSFQFTGPQSVPFSAKNPVITGTPYAPWRVLAHTAWPGQTGRAGKTFTACAGTVANLACTKPSQGTFPAIIKNIGGPGGGFGGTMGLVLTTSPLAESSLAIKIGANQTLLFNIVGGNNSRAAGRGYAAYDIDPLDGGMIYLMYTLTTPGPYGLIAGVMTPIGTGPTGTNMNLGFPFTTGDIIVRGTGSNGMGGPNGQTITAMGFDTTTTMGNRNIQLVAGSIAQSSIQGPNGTPNYTILRLPEPGAAMQWMAGVAGLLAIAAWRDRRAR